MPVSLGALTITAMFLGTTAISGGYLGTTQVFGGSTAFSPSSLFAASEPGVWFDPSDVANLAWRRNLLTYTEQFDAAIWGRDGTTVSVASGPQEWYLANSGVSGASALTQAISPSGDAIFAIDLKADTIRYVRLRFLNVTNAGLVNLDLQAGTSDGAPVTDVGGGFYRFYLPFTSGADNNGIISIQLSDSYNSGSIVGDVSKRIIIRRPQFELGSTATEYQRITDVVTETRERFPSATLYQDTAGTAPVTTPGQTVALMLDKSKGLALGAELVTNGDFSSPTTTGWSPFVEATVSVDGARLKLTSPGGNPYAVYAISTAANKWYSFSVGYDGASHLGQISIYPASNTGGANLASPPNVTGSGVRTCSFMATGTTSYVLVQGLSVASGVSIFFDNISVRELAGNHATQATAASRPTYGVVPLGGRRNLLTYSEQMDNAVWGKTNTTVTANAAAAPDSTTTADKLVETTASAGHFASQGVSVGAVANTFSVYLKADTRTRAALIVQEPTTFINRGGIFDLSSGTYVGTGPYTAPTSTSILDVGGGWYRVSISTTTAVNNATILLVNSGTTVSYTGDGTSGILLWGAQLELGSTATPYQRVSTAFDVTEAGVQSLSYLSFDGVDDFMVTPTITPGIDRAQVFAGVRKLSDAALGMIAEFSANAGSNAGSFYFCNADTAPRLWASAARGLASLSGPQTGFATNAAPDTAVIAVTHDIAGDLSTLRRNAVDGTSGSGDKGTGNFLAYPLYLGRRGGTTLPFNGNVFGMIVRFGANLTAQQITDTETWVNSRTGAYA